MRLIHTADWHLGHELHGFDREAEHDAFLTWLRALLRARTVDALIVAGDIYDSVNPPVPVQRRLFAFLAGALAENPSLSIVLIGGNHDSGTRLELPQPLLDSGRCAIIGTMPRSGGAAAPEATLVPLPGAVCAAIPFLRPGDIGGGGVDGGDIAAMYARAAEAADPSLPLIMMGHLHLAGGEVSELSERRIVMGGEEAVAATVFPARARYVALGHLHRPQQISGPTLIRYAGAPFPLSATERLYHHSVALVEIGNGPAQVELIEIPRPVPLLRAPPSGALELEDLEAALLALEIPHSPLGAPYLEIAVRLSGPQPGLRGRIETALAGKAVRLVRIERVAEGLAEGMVGVAGSGIALGDLTPPDVFARRHRELYGTEPAEDLLTAFHTLWGAVI